MDSLFKTEKGGDTRRKNMWNIMMLIITHQLTITIQVLVLVNNINNNNTFVYPVSRWSILLSLHQYAHIRYIGHMVDLCAVRQHLTQNAINWIKKKKRNKRSWKVDGKYDGGESNKHSIRIRRAAVAIFCYDNTLIMFIFYYNNTTVSEST